MKIFLSHGELVKQLDIHHSIIGKYGRDEMQPNIEAAKKIAKLVGTTVGYLLGETEQSDLFKDQKMLHRLQDNANLPEKERECLLTTVDHFIKTAKINLI